MFIYNDNNEVINVTTTKVNWFAIGLYKRKLS